MTNPLSDVVLKTSTHTMMSQKPEIALLITSEDPDDINLAQTYWQTNAYGKFQFTIADLALRFRSKPYQIQQRVQSVARAYIKASKCNLCEKPTHFLSRRADYYAQEKSYAFQPWQNPNFLCPECEILAQARRKEKNQTKEQPIYKPHQAIGNVFGEQQKLRNLYIELREQYPVVLIRVPFTQFLDSEALQFLAPAEKWKTIQADILVCSSLGIPKKAYINGIRPEEELDIIHKIFSFVGISWRRF
ncbi:MAG: hypothetical protein JJT94_13165 [Bernardetiaceae bacterium]|nr:hypothetical protein [Bernardetiaceae bacterium]